MTIYDIKLEETITFSHNESFQEKKKNMAKRKDWHVDSKR